MATGLPNLVTSLPGPKAKAIIERDAEFISPSYTRSYPLVACRGEGAIIEDVDGNRFLDCSAGIAVVATGHCHPRVVEAIQRQAARLIHMSGTDFYYENMVELAEKLGARVVESGWRGYAKQKNYAAEQASNDWILSLDADESLSEALEAEIWRLKKRGSEYDAYTVPRQAQYL